MNIIDITFAIRIPCTPRPTNLYSMATMHGNISKNKEWEFELYTAHDGRYNSLVGVELTWAVRRSHPGIKIALTLLNRSIEFHVYDSRHYNGNTLAWYNDEDML